jgi:pimeloyl-ACP methyl ester carboxylesterase
LTKVSPPLHSKPGEGYVDFWSNLVYLGVPILNFMRKSALEGLEREAVQVDFSSRLKELEIPVAFFAGKNKASIIPSDITEEILHCYQSSIPDCEIIEFLESGHMIPDEEQKKYLEEIQLFIKKLTDKSNTIK